MSASSCLFYLAFSFSARRREQKRCSCMFPPPFPWEEISFLVDLVLFPCNSAFSWFSRPPFRAAGVRSCIRYIWHTISSHEQEGGGGKEVRRGVKSSLLNRSPRAVGEGGEEEPRQRSLVHITEHTKTAFHPLSLGSNEPSSASLSLARGLRDRGNF